MKIKALVFIFLMVFVSACTIKPEKIAYGKDACNYCKMNIVDKTLAAQLVTKKGKQYKYDAIECFLNDLKTKDQSKIGLIFVTDYNTPEKMIDAKTATYIISDAIQSPMGASLASFESKDIAVNFIKKNDGKLYTWSEIQQYFQTK
jgi:copper chaperone NosL